MFETSVVQARAIPSRGKYTLLTVSLIAHSAIIIGAIVIGIASVSFPKSAPDEFAVPMFSSVQLPPPLGDPNGGAQQKAPEQPKKQAVTPPPTQITAPPTTPETVTPVQNEATGTEVADGPGTGTVPGPIGVPWGTKDSLGDINAPPVVATPQPVEEKIYTTREVKAPINIHRVEPQYPAALARVGVKGKVAIHCVIDKNGRVRDPQVVFATMPAFAESVLRVMKDWRYQPASLNGQAVDCYLDLTVDFGVVR